MNNNTKILNLFRKIICSLLCIIKNTKNDDLKTEASYYLDYYLKQYELYNNKHICLIGENSYNFLVIFMSIVISGNCVVIIDKDLDSNDIKKMLKNTNTNTCFYSQEYCDNLENIAAKMYKIEDIILKGRQNEFTAEELSNISLASFL